MPLPAVQLEEAKPTPIPETEPEEIFEFDEFGQARVSAQYTAWFLEQEARLVTEDDKPVDSLFSEVQQRLLVESLYAGHWTPPASEAFPQGGRSFWAAANIGLFNTLPAIDPAPPLAPDVFLSLDVKRPTPPLVKSYVYWRLNKWPELAIEIVSNTQGDELGEKKKDYARRPVPYYVVFDPFEYLKQGVLQMFRLRVSVYEPMEQASFPELGLGLTLWNGVYEKSELTYLRWTDAEGNLLPTSYERAEREAERATIEAERAERETERAEREAERAEREAERAARLAAKLRELGIDPEQV